MNRSLVIGFLSLLLAVSSQAFGQGVKTWDGGGGTNKWNEPLNWSPDGVPTSGDTVRLSGNLVSVVLDSHLTSVVAKLTILTGASLSLDTILTVDDSLFVDGTSSMTLNAPAELTVNGHLLINGALTPNTSILRLNGADQNISLSGSASFNVLRLSGSGTKSLLSDISFDQKILVDASINFDLNNHLVTGTGVTDTLELSSGDSLLIGGPNPASVAEQIMDAASAVVYDGGAQNVAAMDFPHLVLRGTSTKTLAGDASVSGDLSIEPSISIALIRFDLQTFDLDGTGGSNTLTVGSGDSILVGGSNNIPSGFETVALASSSVFVFNGANQSISPLSANYERVVFRGSGTKTLSAAVIVNGSVSVEPSLTFDLATFALTGNGGSNTLTLSAGDSLFVGGAANAPTTFETLTLDPASAIVYTGSNQTVPNLAANYQHLVLRGTGTKTLSVGITVAGDLRVEPNLRLDLGSFSINGVIGGTNTFTLAAGDTVLVGGSAPSNFSSPTMDTNSVFIYNSGLVQAISNYGAPGYGGLYVLGAGTKFLQSSGVSVQSDLRVFSGATLDLDGNNLLVGTDGQDTVQVDGILEVNGGGAIQLGSGSTGTLLYVSSAGRLNVVGTSESSLAQVTRNGSFGGYRVIVDGTIAGEDYLFQYLSSAGLVVNASGVIDPAQNFSDGYFANGTPGGVFLRIENGESHVITNVSFGSDSSGAAMSNVRKDAAAGTLEFKDYAGQSSGAAHEVDANGLISWTKTTVDAFGHRYTTGNYSWAEFSGGVTIDSSLGNWNSGLLNIGFTFNYFGTNYSQVDISENGFLSFSALGFSPGGYATNQIFLPSTAVPNNIVAPYWDNLATNSAGTADRVRYKTIGTAPNRQFVVTWENVDLATVPGSQTLTFQVVLYETSNLVKFQYKTLSDANNALGQSATIALEDAAGTDGLAYSKNYSSLTEESAILFHGARATSATSNITPNNLTPPKDLQTFTYRFNSFGGATTGLGGADHFVITDGLTRDMIVTGIRVNGASQFILNSTSRPPGPGFATWNYYSGAGAGDDSLVVLTDDLAVRDSIVVLFTESVPDTTLGQTYDYPAQFGSDVTADGYSSTSNGGYGVTLSIGMAVVWLWSIML